MEFLDISSLGAAYRYVVKIKQKFKQRNKRGVWICECITTEVRKRNPNTQNKGQRKDGQPQDNQSKPQTKKGNGKTKKDTGKWCEFHKIPWHNTDECHSKQSLVAEMKASESDPGSNSDSEPDKGKQIIDAEPSATVTTTKIQPNEPEESEEGECLFHSQMWVKGAPLHFIVDRKAKRTSSQ
jgi:hypothetical protein